MEKCYIKTCIKKETQKGVFYTVELIDGRKGISSDDLTTKLGMEVELDVKEGKPYDGVMQYYFNLPKSQAAGASKFPQKDWSYEKRRASLENAISAIKLTGKEVTSVNIIALSNEFYNYLNTK
jgi:hypothetical protein